MKEDISGSVHTRPEECENSVLFLRLGLLSVLVRNENGGVWKCRLFVFMWAEIIFENRAFWKQWSRNNHVISLPDFFSNTDPKWSLFLLFLISCGVMWMKISEWNLVFNFLRCIVDGVWNKGGWKRGSLKGNRLKRERFKREKREAK